MQKLKREVKLYIHFGGGYRDYQATIRRKVQSKKRSIEWRWKSLTKNGVPL
jgi:hypothetical protein